MSKRSNYIALLYGILLGSFTSYALSDEISSHVLMADYAENGLVYTIDGRTPDKQEGVLLALGRKRSGDSNPQSEIILLVHERATLADVYNMIGMTIKADYTSYRVFVFDSDKASMTEVSFSSPVEFSLHGAIPNVELSP